MVSNVTSRQEPTTAAPAAVPIISHWINGRPVEVLPKETGPVYDPATGEDIARVPRGGAEVEAAVEAATKAFPAWRDTPLIARSQIFFAFRELCWNHREEMARLITRDHGKTYPDALGEVVRGLETIEFACGLPVHMAGMNTPNVSTDVDVRTLRQPLGVTAAITPFNFPAMVPMWIYPIALMSGNTMIWKPISHTPGATQLQAELWTQAGLPDGVFNVVYGGREAVNAIVEHPDVQAIQFVGSTTVGGTSTRRARRLGKRVGCYMGQERHGRTCPTLTWSSPPTPRSPRATARPVSAAWPRRLVIAVGDIGDRLRPLMKERIAKLKIGPGMEPGMDMGPIYSAEHRESDHQVDRQGRGRGRGARRGRTPVPAPGAPKRLLPGRHPLRQRHPGDEHLPRGDIRPRPRHGAGQDLRRGARAHQRTPVRQRDRHLHDRRWRCPALRARGRRPHDRRQRPHPGARRLPLLRRHTELRLRRPRHARRGLHTLLHEAEGGHRPLAEARPSRGAEPGVPG